MNALIDIISKTFDANQEELNSALAYLNRIADEDFTNCVLALVELICSREQLVNNNQPIVPYKLQSCLQLKNLLLRKPDAWHGLASQVKQTIKCSILACFELEHVRFIGLSHVVLTLAKLELPQQSWADLIPGLLNLATVPDDGGSVAIQTLGYICESIHPDCLEAYSNQILTVLVHTIKRDDVNVKTKLAGLTALHNSLTFAASNFARQSERNYLMQVICDSTQHIHTETRILSLQCLCRALTLYYPLMDSYLVPAVWPIVMSALSSTDGKEEIVLQGLEVINSVCDSEIKLLKECGEEEESQGSECLQPVLPQLLTSITQAFLSAGPSLPVDWSVGQATQISLRMLTRAAPGAMVNLLVTNILQNLGHGDPMVQSCVLTCAAALMEGTSEQQVGPVIQAFLDSLPLTLFNQNIKVRYHAGIALAQLCLHQHNTLHSMGALSFLLSIINKTLEVCLDQHVAEHACWALRYLAENLGADRMRGVVAQEFIQTAGLLYNLAVEAGNQASSLEKVSFECLLCWLDVCPDESVYQLQAMLTPLLDRAQLIPDHSPSLVYTCTALDIILSKLPEDLLQHKCQLLFSYLCQLIKHKTGMEEEALGAITRILDRVPQQFLACPLQPLITLLLDKILTNVGSLMVSCIGLISDIYRASSDHHQVPCPQYSTLLLVSLLDIAKDTSLEEIVRSVSLGTVSDIILCIEKYALPVFPTISQVLASLASGHQWASAQAGQQLSSSAQAGHQLSSSAQAGHQPSSSLGPQLIKSIIETYSTLIQVFHNHTEFREVFVSNDVDRVGIFIQCLDVGGFCCEDEVLAVMCGLIGDLCKYFGEAELSDYLSTFHRILDQAIQSGESKTRRIARWARDQMSTGSSINIVKKARLESDNCMEMSSTSQPPTFRVSMTCSTSQFITQNIEESFTLNLGKKKDSTRETLQPDVNSNYVEATIRIPSRNKPVVTEATAFSSLTAGGDHSYSAVKQLRKLGKRRACFLAENNEGKKIKDEVDEEQDLLW